MRLNYLIEVGKPTNTQDQLGEIIQFEIEVSTTINTQGNETVWITFRN